MTLMEVVPTMLPSHNGSNAKSNNQADTVEGHKLKQTKCMH